MNIAHALGKGMIVFYLSICSLIGILKLDQETSELENDTLKGIARVGIFLAIATFILGNIFIFLLFMFKFFIKI